MGNFKYSLVVLFIVGYLFSDVQSLNCWRCNSKDSPDCAKRPGNIEEFGEDVVCPEADLCAMAILADNSTHRGCTSEIPEDAQSSATCNDNLCNTPIYPEDRLQCHQCEGTTCLSVADGAELPCTQYVKDDECYTDVIDFSDAYRGCVSDGYDDTDYRRECQTNGCNNQPAVSTFSCLKCDSLDDPNCKSGPSPGEDCSVLGTDKCEKQLLFGRIEHCFTYRNGERVVRGCSIDEPEYVMQYNYVRECILNECNDECISPIDCYVCDSQNSQYCSDGSVGNLTAGECPIGTSSCHTCRDGGGTIYRGCGNYEGQATCTSCWNDPNCNNKKMNRCFSCKSSEDENCDTWENIGSIDQVICNGNCIATLREGIVERGCQSNSFDCQPSLTCKSCSEDDCNSGRVPDARLRCYQCDENDPSCIGDQSTETAPPCPIVEDENDQCYVFATSDNKMVRGCSTDQRYYECLMSPPGKCVVCSGDECNSRALIGKLTCLQCDSEIDDECIDGFRSETQECVVGTSKFCEVDVPFGEYEYCYTYRNGQRVMRGCSKENPNIANQIKYVRECRLDNCNSDCIDPAKCYVCDSKTNGNCARYPFLIEQTSCENEEISCYTCRDSEGTTLRGCGGYNGAAECSSCWNDPGCNDGPMLRCYSCSSEDDENCKTWTNPTSIDQVTCNGFCITTIRDNIVLRGCQSPSFDCETSATCTRCENDDCNNGPFTSGLNCFQCDENDPTCINDQSGNDAPNCPVYAGEGDKCYVFATSGNKMVRGCSTDDRYSECLRQPAGKCVTCSGDGCNSQPLIGKLTCLKCDSNVDANCVYESNQGSNECAISTSNTCEVDVMFGDYEYCYTYRNGQRVIRGCSKQDTSISSQIQLIRECRYENCNNECIEPAKCYSCDSKTNSECAKSPFMIPQVICEAGEISCYTCRDSEGTTLRGCGGYNGAAECSSCWNDPGCNDGPMLRCYSCSSEDDENCKTWTNPTSIDQVTCNGFCITTIRDDIVLRGCQSPSFDCETSATCIRCENDNCNNGPFASGLSCFQCDENDPACINDQSGNNAPNCPVYAGEGDKCYVFATSGNKMVRGCSTDDRYLECLRQPAGKCVTCSGDGCNSQPLIGKLTCLRCDSNVDANCVYASNQGSNECTISTSNTCEVDVMFGDYEYCYTYRNGQRVIRGCSKQDTSISSQIQLIRECRYENCNNECIEPAKCYSCDSKTNSQCVKGPFTIPQVICGAGEISCYTCRDSDSTIRRGCGNGGTFGQCASCWDDPGCNEKPMLECYACTSYIDKNCADWTEPGRINKNICNGLCIASLRDGYVERGCQSNSFDCPDSDTCIRCDQDSCNGGLVPANRLVCHQCGLNDPNCGTEKDTSLATACTTYAAIDECFYYLDENDKMIRGCASDSSYEDCLENRDRCITCATPGCNKDAALKAPILECSECNGEDSCAWAQTEQKRCTKDIPYYALESCYIYKASDGKVRRGCSQDDNACDPSTDSNCVTCTSSGCNYVNRVYQNCLQCTGTGDEACVSGQNITSSGCSKAVQPYETRGCYAWRDGDKVTRGCLIDLSTEDITKCEKDEANCQACRDQDCNTKDLQGNGANHLSTLSAIILVIIAYIIKA